MRHKEYSESEEIFITTKCVAHCRYSAVFGSALLIAGGDSLIIASERSDAHCEPSYLWYRDTLIIPLSGPITSSAYHVRKCLVKSHIHDAIVKSIKSGYPSDSQDEDQ